MTKKYFGTDGIRARVGTPHMNPEFAVRLGYAAGCAFKAHWHNKTRPSVLIGKDTRISGYLIESALESGFAAAGVDVALLGPIPTPAIAYLTRTFHCCAGVVVSASHNPYDDNGIKFFSPQGFKLDDDLELQIETYLDGYADKPLALVQPRNIGKARRINDAQGRYIEHCKSTVPPGFSLCGLPIILDCANGAAYQVAPAVFTELNADVTVLHNQPDGLNINDRCGSTDLTSLIAAVTDGQADIGIAFDGDGDRVMMVGGDGQVIDGDAIMYIIAKGLIYENRKPQGLVGTLMTNMGAQQAIARLGIDFTRADVGDRHVMASLQQKKWSLGGEASGHIIALDKSTTGDGIVAALQVLKTLKDMQQSLSELLDDYRTFPMQTVNIAVKNKTDIMENQTLNDLISHTNQILKGKGRVLVRASGTEPKIRVTAEAQHEDMLAQPIATISQCIRQIEDNHAD